LPSIFEAPKAVTKYDTLRFLPSSLTPLDSVCHSSLLLQHVSYAQPTSLSGSVSACQLSPSSSLKNLESHLTTK
jgi:hypothetical protein